jgi:hypothetical protein
VIKPRRIREARNVVCRGETTNAYKTSVREHQGMKPFVRPRPRWEDDIRSDCKETECGDIHRIHLPAKELVAGSCVHINEPLGSIKHGVFLD